MLDMTMLRVAEFEAFAALPLLECRYRMSASIHDSPPAIRLAQLLGMLPSGRQHSIVQFLSWE